MQLISSYYSLWVKEPVRSRQQSKAHSSKAHSLTMQNFLAEVEKKAYRMAQVATQNSDDALDIVQDTMMKLVTHYSERPKEQWKPLFYRILQSRIADFYRKKKLQQALFFWKTGDDESETNEYLIKQCSDHTTPERALVGQQEVHRVLRALEQLPHRQQQCFMLRSWEGLNVAETASAMGCSTSSVKTHYARAKQALESMLSTKD